MKDNPILALLKSADGGEDGQDATFEQSMSQIADIVLKDKAPALAKFEVGFQLIDRDSDGDSQRAVGVKVFKVGKAWLFVPIFFLNGEVKGTELLYLKNQDVFVPLQEDWIRHVFTKESEPAGRGIARDEATRRGSRPDLTSLVRPPIKSAAALAEADAMLAGEVLPSWAAALTSDPVEASGVSLPAFLKSAGRPAVLALGALLEARPGLVAAMSRYHDGSLRAAVKEAFAIEPPAPPAWDLDPSVGSLFSPSDPVAEGRLAISGPGVSLGGDLLDGLDDDGPKEAADAEGGVENRLKVRDDRDDAEVSTAVPIEEVDRLENPSRTGVYEVLTGPGEYEKFLVVAAPKTPRGSLATLLVVRLSDKAYGHYLARDVWARAEPDDPEAWDELLRGLDAAGEPAGGPSAGEYMTGTVFLGPNPHRDATAPLRLEGSVGGGEGRIYKVHGIDDRADEDWPLAAPRRPDDRDRHRPHGPEHLVVRDDGGRMRPVEGTLVVPPGCKAMRVVRPPDGDVLLAPGHPRLRLGIAKDAGARTLAVRASRGGYVVDGVRLSPDEAVARLVAGVGLREKGARDVLARADADAPKTTAPTRFLVKSADPYMTSRGPTAPGFPEPQYAEFPTLSGALPGFEQQVEQVPVDSAAASRDDLSGYDVMQPPEDAIRAVGRAAETGRREIFDASMIGSLLATKSPDLQVDRHLGPMFAGVDAVGRVLMSYYWHKKQFGDRYGRSDLASLEDQLRNVFTDLGKLILVLKQRAVRAPFDVQRDLDLDDSDF